MDLWTRFNTNPNFIEQPMFALEFGDPTPPAKKRSGVCVVLGTHPCWLEDLDAVRAKHSKIDVCGVNEAGKLFKLDHIATCHGDRLQYFVDCCIHQLDKPLIHVRKNSQAPEKIEDPHHFWPVRTLAGSGPFAAAAMVMLGYDEVIFCGCPMDGGGGYAFTDTHKTTRDDPRIGFEDSDHKMIKSWHRCMKLFIEQEPEMAKRIKSMSGVTKQLFGGIN